MLDRRKRIFEISIEKTVKIISEQNSRKMQPDYYLVLPWHFKNEILIREKFLFGKPGETTYIIKKDGKQN